MDGGQVKVSIELPIPPSTNNLTANAARGRVKTQEYESWISRAGWALNQAGYHPGKLLTDRPVSVTCQIYGGKGVSEARDGDNTQKAVQDLLVAQGLLKDDNLRYVQKWGGEYFTPEDPEILGALVVVIETIEQEPTPTAMDALRAYQKAVDAGIACTNVYCDSSDLCDECAEVYEEAHRMRRQVLARQEKG
jgi:Holliday junction resolvase RusA-like endonuclease